MKRAFAVIALFCSLVAPVTALAFEEDVLRAHVVQVLEEERVPVPGVDAEMSYQLLEARIAGDDTANPILVRNDYIPLKPDDTLYVVRTVSENGEATYDALEPYRLGTLALLGLLFLFVLGCFGGKQGLRGLVALLLSLGFITFVLLPAVMRGYSPMLVAVLVSGVIVTIGSYITHGVSRTTTSAVIGMLITIAITGLLAALAIKLAFLTGTSGHETFYLEMNSHGKIDLVGLLLGGMLIGFLGVLYDSAIGQAVAIEELLSVGGHTDPRDVLRRAMRIGREHIGALVNTLAIAYTGTALPLILLYYSSAEATLAFTVNREVFATEIVRILVGSIGLILAVPITSVIALALLRKAP